MVYLCWSTFVKQAFAEIQFVDATFHCNHVHVSKADPSSMLIWGMKLDSYDLSLVFWWSVWSLSIFDKSANETFAEPRFAGFACKFITRWQNQNLTTVPLLEECDWLWFVPFWPMKTQQTWESWGFQPIM